MPRTGIKVPKVKAPSGGGGRRMSPDQFMALMRGQEFERQAQALPVEEKRQVVESLPSQKGYLETTGRNAIREAKDISSGIGSILGRAGVAGANLVRGEPRQAGELAKSLGLGLARLPAAVVGSVKQTLTHPVESFKERPIGTLADISMVGTGVRAAGKGLQLAGRLESAGTAARAAGILETTGKILEKADPLMALAKGSYAGAKKLPVIGPAIESVGQARQIAKAKVSVGRELTPTAKALRTSQAALAHAERPFPLETSPEEFQALLRGYGTTEKAALGKIFPVSKERITPPGGLGGEITRPIVPPELRDVVGPFKARAREAAQARAEFLMKSGRATAESLEAERYTQLARDIGVRMTDEQKAAFSKASKQATIPEYFNDDVIKAGVRPNPEQVAFMRQHADPILFPTTFLGENQQLAEKIPLNSLASDPDAISSIINQGAKGSKVLTPSQAWAHHYDNVLRLEHDLRVWDRTMTKGIAERKLIPAKAGSTLEGELEASGKYEKVPVAEALKSKRYQLLAENAILKAFYDAGTLGDELFDAIKQQSINVDDPRVIGALSQSIDKSTKAIVDIIAAKAPRDVLSKADTVFFVDKQLKNTLLKELGFFHGQKSPGFHALDVGTDVFKTGALYLNPAWVVGNAVGNTVLSTIAGANPAVALKMAPMLASDILKSSARLLMGDKGVQAFERFSNFLEKTDIIKRIPGGEQLRKGYLKQIGMGRAAIPEELRGGIYSPERFGKAPLPTNQLDYEISKFGEGKVAKGFQRKMQDIASFNSAIDDAFRNVTYASKAAQLTKLKNTGESFYKSLTDFIPVGPSVLPDAGWNQIINIRENPALLEQALEHTYKFMGDFNTMTAVERTYLRRIFPFYSWMRHVNQLFFLTLPFSHPLRYEILSQSAKMLNEAAVDPKAPEWVKGSTVAGMTADGRTRFVSLAGGNIFMGLGRPELGAHPLLKLGFERLTGRDILRDFQPFKDKNTYISHVDGKAYVRDDTSPTGYSETIVTPPLLSHILRTAIPQTRLIEDILNPALRYTGSGIFDPQIRGEINDEIEKLQGEIGQARLKGMQIPKFLSPEKMLALDQNTVDLGRKEARLERMVKMRDAGALSVYDRDRFYTFLGAMGIKVFAADADELKAMIERNDLENLTGVLNKAIQDPDLRMRIWDRMDELAAKSGRPAPMRPGERVPTRGQLLAPTVPPMRTP